MSLNYSIIDTMKLYSLAFSNDMFISLIIGAIILTLIFIINKDSSYIKYIILSINVVSICITMYYYIANIFSFKF